MSKLTEKIIVLTGAGGQLGTNFSKTIAENNGIVIATDVNENSLNLLSDINSNNIIPRFMDITDKLSIDNLITEVVNKYGKIDAVVNNAYPRNKNYGKKLENVNFQDFCENIDMHLGGYFLSSQRFAEHFLKQKEGNIINMSSIYGVVAPKFEIYANTEMTMPVEYAAIKSAIIHLTKYFASYYKGKGIRANSISPGGILNDQPSEFISSYNKECLSKGMLSENDVAGVLIFLLSDASSYINGQNFIVDDGFTL